MKKTISFVRTFIPADLFKKEYALGGLTIYHLNEQLNAEMNAYECFECSVRNSEYTQDDVLAAFEEFKTKLAASELATAKAQKLAEIDACDQSPAVNGFSLNGATVWLDKSTRVGLMNSTNITKAMGQPTTTLWLGESKMEVPCDTAIQLLSALEMYALECFNVTAAHKKAVSELTSIEEVEKYDITAGYPAQLKMEV
uniref:DUF4376 domain-containing protein n=1 Tax=Prevotella sp. TaxID=59823 RepID=UPI00402638BB